MPPFLDGLRGLGHLAGIAHIGLDDEGFASNRLDQFHRALCFLFTMAILHRHLPASVAESSGDRPPDAP
jgi:hypothetical protein